VQVYAKLVAQDMSYFETKFTKPRQAQQVLYSQTSQFMQVSRRRRRRRRRRRKDGDETEDILG
jgi:hypothetical protein